MKKVITFLTASTLALTFVGVAEASEFTLAGLNNASTYVNQEGSFTATLNVPNQPDATYTMALSGGDATLTAASGGWCSGGNILDNSCKEELVVAENAYDKTFSVTFLGTEIKTHNLVFTVEDSDTNIVFEHQFTLDVRNRPSGGSSSSRSSDRNDDKGEEVEEAEDEEDSALESEGEEYNPETMTDGEKAELVNDLRSRLLALLLELLARLQALLRAQ